MASQYDGREPHDLWNLYGLVTKRATARGFLVTDHQDQMSAFPGPGHIRPEIPAKWLRP
ncbi:hypothetical protein ABZ897_33360 [Nonomuraea sp. NPDC046802]|uniref:hypothetical protein n=1 Tax=Nonomuraea sp. NPDC046802 TaxID=3154919 RepID=UPI0033CDC489